GSKILVRANDITDNGGPGVELLQNGMNINFGNVNLGSRMDAQPFRYNLFSNNATDICFNATYFRGAPLVKAELPAFTQRCNVPRTARAARTSASSKANSIFPSLLSVNDCLERPAQPKCSCRISTRGSVKFFV